MGVADEPALGERRPSGGPEGVASALQATKTGSERFRVLMMITNAQMKAGDREAALTTLQQAMLTTKSVGGR